MFLKDGGEILDFINNINSSGKCLILVSFHIEMLQSPPKKSIHLEKGRVLKIQEGQINFRGSPILPMELVKSGLGPVGKVKEMATQGAKV